MFESDDFEDDELEELDKKPESEKKKKKNKKKTWIYISLCVLLFVVLSVIEGFQDRELIRNGKPMEVTVIDRQIEKEHIIFKHPTLTLYVDNELKKVWVKQETYDKALLGNKIHVIKYKGEVKLDPRYDYEDLVIERY
ncbi:hypothetical protein COL32_16540 [Bacillus pseudomycoides]|nr:hypothetical protein CON70_25790 [Bacillus pseudomycoides]PFW95759.1 hypothetical protein COL29_08845 [Bacillus pseudomycoides]PFX42250.1 hypothetical protein COL32_16540 [Bacillus pseudomycoides]PGF09609.1 hypothetical protein COM59_07900 [Bacillus pseudomycoides]PHC39905.1 hypothetical protein COF01_08995 [Bacillus pseudomycoides]